MKTIISTACLGLLLSCSHTKEVTSEPIKEVRTNGVYIAYDSYSNSVKDIQSMKAVEDLKVIAILRFLDQKNGVIIPSQISKGEVLNKEKIMEMYNWTLDFEKKNPDMKDWVHFTLTPNESDSIIIVQHSGRSFSSYKGTNEKDSLLLNHDMGLEMPGTKLEDIKRPMVFKFYPLEK